jgi:hypothetical protein
MDTRKVDADGYEATITVEPTIGADGNPVAASWVLKAVITKVGSPNIEKYQERICGVNGVLLTEQDALSHGSDLALRYIEVLRKGSNERS